MSTFDTLRGLAMRAGPGHHVYLTLHFSDRIVMHPFGDVRLHDQSGTFELVSQINPDETRVRYVPAAAVDYVTVDVRDQSLEDMMSDMEVPEEAA